MLANGMDALRAAQVASLAADAVYRRGAEETPIRAVLGRTAFQSRNDRGVWVRVESRDFIVTAGRLGFEPQAGDEIECGGATYEVLAPDGEGVWRWSDPQRTAMRIHAKLTGGT